MVFRISRGPYITSFHLFEPPQLGKIQQTQLISPTTPDPLQHFLTAIRLDFAHPWYTVPSLPASNKRWKRVISKWPACGSRGKMAGTLLPSFLRWSISYKVSNRNATLRVEWLYMTLIIFHESSDFLKWNTGLGWLLQTKITVLGNKDQFSYCVFEVAIHFQEHLGNILVVYRPLFRTPATKNPHQHCLHVTAGFWPRCGSTKYCPPLDDLWTKSS